MTIGCVAAGVALGFFRAHFVAPANGRTIDSAERILMFPLLVACFLSPVIQENDARMLKQLDDDFNALLKDDPSADKVRDAAKQLERITPKSLEADVLKPLLVLRQTRSKAGIPLLLKCLFKHAGYACHYSLWQDYTDAFATFTGKSDFPQQGIGWQVSHGRAAVRELVNSWWTPNRQTITTNLAEMSLDERVNVALALIAEYECQTGYIYRPDQSLAFDLSQDLSAFHFAESHCDHRQRTLPQELHPSVLPAFLALSRNQKPLTEDSPPSDGKDGHLSLDAVPLMAMMYADGHAAELPKIATDEQQNTATRLMCLMAMHRAGHDLKTKDLLPLLKTECRQKSKIVAVLLLGRCVDVAAAVPDLVRLLDNEDEELRSAAILALRSAKAPKEALPRLKKVLTDVHPVKLVRATLQVLANMHCEEATAILAEFLSSALHDSEKAVYLRDALVAFEGATGREWLDPERSRALEDWEIKPPDLKDAAQQALQEWNNR
jgi:hypothetical protein